ncbi:hypothetical protein HY500_04545 [Candidatus Woesearchaeota archaeon]|nr:hypothetical protein [Candidatus Woesearchaeota archaeon]
MTVLRLTMSPGAQKLYNKLQAIHAARRIIRDGRAAEKDLEALEGLVRRADGTFTRRSQNVVRQVAYALENQTPVYNGIDIRV